jgi:hypothetical protein
MFGIHRKPARRVSLLHENGTLVIHIARHNLWRLYIAMFVFFTLVFGIFCYILAPALFGIHSATDLVYVLPFVVFVAVWYWLCVRLSLWRVFGVEEVIVGHGTLHWERKALCWNRILETPQDRISKVVARTPWYGLSNRVQFTADGRTYKIGDMILQDEANEIASALEQAILQQPPAIEGQTS